MSLTQGPLAMLGGAFDPVHFGHLRTAAEIYTYFELAELRFVPSANPSHRPPHRASTALRMRMLEAATADLLWCSVDDRELRRDGPSWSVLTLEEMRAEAGDRSLCMILGMDAFLGLTRWHRWEELTELAHLLVAHRPGWQPPDVGPLGDFVHARLSSDVADLHASPAGRLFIHEVTQLEIASSAIREVFAADQDPRFLMPEAAIKIATESGCYADQAGPGIEEKSINV
jgi:nicotinate-nucleotide adenylyltransferase